MVVKLYLQALGLSIFSTAAAILNFSLSMSSGRGDTNNIPLYNPTEISYMDWDRVGEVLT
jgi:hypothetical protein